MNQELMLKVEKPVHDTVEKATLIKVINQQTYLDASDYLSVIKGVQKEVNGTFDPIVKKAYEAHKEAKAQKDKFLVPLKTAETSLKTKMISYDAEQIKIAREKQDKLDAQAKAEQERKENALKERARKAEEAGKYDKAEELKEKASNVEVVAPVYQPQTVQVKGQSIKETWYAEITDLKALVKEVADGKAPISFLLPNMPILNKQAQSMKDTWKYAGVDFKSKKTMSARG